MIVLAVVVIAVGLDIAVIRRGNRKSCCGQCDKCGARDCKKP